MAWNIYPTETPVGDWSGDDCDRAREFQHADWMNYLHQSPLHSFRCSGGVFTKGAGDSLDIPTGIYIIDGRAVENDAAENLVITSARPTYLFARLLKTGDLVTSAEYFANDTGALPSEPHVLIGQIAAGDAITASAAYPRVCTGSFTGTGSAKTVFLGFQPAKVELTLTASGSQWYSMALTGGIGAGTSRIEIGESTYYNLVEATSSSAEIPTITTFGFSAPAKFSDSGDTTYWTAWA